MPRNRSSLSPARPRKAAAVCAFTLTASLGGGLLGVLPAHAVVSSSVSITGDGATFDLASDPTVDPSNITYGGHIQEGSLDDYYGPGSARTDAFDNFGYVIVNGTPVSGLLTSDGVSATTDPQTDPTTGLTTQLTFAAQQDATTVRILARITADGAHGDQSATVTYSGDYGSDDETTIQATSSGDTTLDTTDNFLVTSDLVAPDSLPPFNPDPINTTVFQGPNARTTSTSTTLSLDIFEADFAPVVVPAGETRYFVFYQQLSDTIANAVASAPTTYGNPLASAPLLAGLTDEQLADTVNMRLVVHPPSVPQNVTAAQTGPRQVTVSFTPSADAGTSPITGYSVGIAGPSGTSSAVYPADTRSHVFDDLNPGDYTFSAGAVSDDGASALASTSLQVAAPVVPPVVPPVPALPTIHLADTSIPAGAKSHVNGTTLPNALVELDGYTRPSVKYVKLASTHADAQGHYALTLTVAANSRMRVTVPGAGTSRSVVENVRSMLDLAVSKTGLRTFVFTGTVKPHRAGQLVSIVVRTKAGERIVAHGRTGADGHYRIVHTFPASQHNVYTAFARVDRDLVTWGNTSAGRTFTVVRAV